jgi:prepilin-type N-terminal cleavage/methylation domain-containing protein
MKKLLNKKGFTLIELIVVIAIIAILAAILIPALLGYIDSATYTRHQSNARSHYTAAMLYAATMTGTAPSLAGCTYTAANNQVTNFTCTWGAYGPFTVANNFHPRGVVTP